MIRRKPLKPGNGLQPGSKRLKSRRRAIGAATVAEQAQQDSQRRKGCALCRLLGIPFTYPDGDPLPAGVSPCGVTEVHHRTTGDLHGQKQLGQAHTVALGSYHHRGALLEEFPTVAGMLAQYGPSLHHHKREFLELIAERLGERSTAALQRWQDAQPEPNE